MAMVEAAQPIEFQDTGGALSIRNLSKSFGGAKALNGIDLEIANGEIHGLLGQNGSGKSTLVKILAGVHAPDPGASLTLHGKPVPLPLRAGAFRHLGLSFVHQNLGLVPSLSVLENLRVGPLISPDRLFINWSRERAAAQAAFARFEIAIDPGARLSSLSQTDRALVAIVRAFEEVRASGAVTGHPGLLLLDEPTPFLPREGVEKLFTLMRAIVAQGASVIFISHDIDEILEITDRATILRDGNLAGHFVTRTATRDSIVEAIVGRRIQKFRSETPAQKAERPVSAVFDGVSGEGLKSCSFTLHEGEVVGLTGLIGSGYERVPYFAFGAAKAENGTLTLSGARIDLTAMRPKAAIDKGMALLPGDRQNQSGVGALPIADNLMLLDLERFRRFGLLDRGKLTRRSAEIGKEFELRPNNPALPLSALSGGNAQKVLLAKWMKLNPKLLMLDEPTQGVDVGARQQIFGAIRAATAQGMAVLCASSDYEQLAEICDRVLIFARGAIIAELTGDDITKDHIAERCYGSGEIENE
jgi:ribose transport system ATP-binding protein